MVKLCSEKLAAAEKRIEMVTLNAAEKPQIVEYDPATPAVSRSEKGTSKQTPAEDVSLF